MENPSRDQCQLLLSLACVAPHLRGAHLCFDRFTSCSFAFHRERLQYRRGSRNCFRASRGSHSLSAAASAYQSTRRLLKRTETFWERCCALASSPSSRSVPRRTAATTPAATSSKDWRRKSSPSPIVASWATARPRTISGRRATGQTSRRTSRRWTGSTTPRAGRSKGK